MILALRNSCLVDIDGVNSDSKVYNIINKFKRHPSERYTISKIKNDNDQMYSKIL